MNVVIQIKKKQYTYIVIIVLAINIENKIYDVALCEEKYYLKDIFRFLQ